MPAETASNIVEHKPRTRAVAAATPTPLDIVQAALKTGNVEMYREAVALMKEMDAFAARKAFDNAMADAKAEIPTIRKNREVAVPDKNGKTGPKYKFEDLAEIARTIDPILSRHGLSYRFTVSSEINQPVRVSCIVSHRDGHFTETTLTSGRDDGPGRNAIQQIGSTISYLQRYTLKAALGLAAAADDDGAGAEAEPESEYVPPPGSITREQAEKITDLLEAKGINRKSFLQWANASRVEDIPAEIFDSCITAINNFRSSRK